VPSAGGFAAYQKRAAAQTRTFYPGRPARCIACRHIEQALLEAEAARTDELLVTVAEALGRKGVKIVRTTLPSDFEAIEPIHRCVSGYEFARALSWERLEHQDKLSQSLVNGRMADGLTIKIEDYHKASTISTDFVRGSMRS